MPSSGAISFDFQLDRLHFPEEEIQEGANGPTSALQRPMSEVSFSSFDFGRSVRSTLQAQT